MLHDMGFEIDFLPVGIGEKSGDAIAIRWGHLADDQPQQRVMVIDGGTEKSGQALVEHIGRYYATDNIDVVICTHCDADHASGLATILEQLRVGALFMHEPWRYASNIRDLVTDGRVTERSLTRRMLSGLQAAHNLHRVAEANRVPVIEPFAGHICMDFGAEMRVLGPERYWYQELLSKFRCVPSTHESRESSLAEVVNQMLEIAHPTPRPGISDAYNRAMSRLGTEAVDTSPVAGTDNILDDSGTTSAENNSSAIVLLTIYGHKLLFTGDAGVEALTRAINFGEQCGLDFSDLALFDVPHHGSEQNLSPCVLDRFSSRVAVVSAGTNASPRHPSSKITNALIDRQSMVFATRGHAFCYRYHGPQRTGWVEATPIPYDHSLGARRVLGE